MFAAAIQELGTVRLPPLGLFCFTASMLTDFSFSLQFPSPAYFNRFLFA
jgi:hypothetical protein